MALKLYAPGERRGNKTYVAYGWWNGRPFERSLNTRDPEEAETRFLELQVGLRRQKAVGGDLTYADADEDYRVIKQIDPRSDLAKVLDAIRGQLRDMQAASITSADLQRVAIRLYPRGKPATRNRMVIVPAAAILHRLAEDGKIPWQRYKKFKEEQPEPRPASPEDAKLLVQNTTDYKRLLIMFLFDHGWRISEALSVRWEHIDLTAGMMMHHNSKANEWTRIPIHSEVLTALANVPAADRQGKLFPWETKSGVYKWLRPLVKQLGVRFTPHMARHSFATWLVEQGETTEGLLATRNWRDPKSASRYVRVNPNRAKTTLAKLKGIGHGPGKA